LSKLIIAIRIRSDFWFSCIIFCFPRAA